MSHTHTVRGTLRHVHLEQRGDLPTIVMQIEQAGRYTSSSIRTLRSYTAAQAEQAKRHYMRLTLCIDQVLHVNGAALVALPHGVTLLGVDRVALVHDTPRAPGPLDFAPTEPAVQDLPAPLSRLATAAGAVC